MHFYMDFGLWVFLKYFMADILYTSSTEGDVILKYMVEERYDEINLIDYSLSVDIYAAHLVDF